MLHIKKEIGLNLPEQCTTIGTTGVLPLMPSAGHTCSTPSLMAVQCPITLALVNMHRRNTVTHALLNSDTHTNLFLLQEPWFDTIGTARSDSAWQGVDMLGGITSPGWETIYPTIPKGLRLKVMAYARKRAINTQLGAPFTTVPHHDISDHPCLLVLDIVFDDKTWHVINFYHDIWDNSSLQALMAIDIDAVTLTLVVGDFNTHSPTWSPPGISRLGWAGQVEEWAASNLLTLANNPGEITCWGSEHERDSVIDLAWYNEAAVQHSTFSNLHIDWYGSLGSDHALIQMDGHAHSATPHQPMGVTEGFVTDLD